MSAMAKFARKKFFDLFAWFSFTDAMIIRIFPNNPTINIRTYNVKSKTVVNSPMGYNSAKNSSNISFAPVKLYGVKKNREKLDEENKVL